VRKTISAMAGQAGTDRWIMTGGIFPVAGCYLVTAAGSAGEAPWSSNADWSR
jgi:hypothetical protein